MDYWNHDPSADAINRVRGAVADVKSVMIENIEKVWALHHGGWLHSFRHPYTAQPCMAVFVHAVLVLLRV